MAAFTFLFTDIEGSTALLQRVGESVYARALADHHALIRSALTAHGGREVDTAGDGFFAVFSSPGSCLAAVLEMQRSLGSYAWPGGELVRVRMGVHCGEAAQTVTGLVGLDVHRAARIAAVGHGGQVLVSETAALLTRDALPTGAALQDLGVHRLKDLGRPLRLFQLCGSGLRAEFPPLRSLGSPGLPTNLPTELTAFVGRDREVSDVRALVTSSRLVTLAGPGGAGKTRLGLQVAAELLGGFEDGVWLVELAASTDEKGIAAAIGESLGMSLQPTRALEMLADALAVQQMLIVLDNCEHLITSCAKTADALLRRCPKLQLLATSREPLAIGGETIYRVPPLSLPAASDSDPAAVASSDAVALLADRAWAQGVNLTLNTHTVPLVASICRTLDGMPLAIELAAARLRSMSLADLASRLDQRFRLLTGGSRSVLERQQTLLAAIDWSYSLLSDAERMLLGRLSVFAGGFDLAAAESVCGFGGVDVLEVPVLLGSLVDKSLVTAESAGDSAQYRLLETIRLFAAERLTRAGYEEEAVAAHCAHYLAIAEAAAPHLSGPEQASWLARLDADRDNMRRAVEHAARQPGTTSLALRFSIALWPYWATRSPFGRVAALLVPVLRRPEACEDPALFAESLCAAAFFTVNVDLATGLKFAEQAAEVALGLGDERLIVLSHAILCLTYADAGEFERARLVGQDSAERARRLGDDVLLALSVGIYAFAAEPVESAVLYAEAIACAERSGDIRSMSILHNGAGYAALQAGDITGAIAHLEAAKQAAEAIGESLLRVSVNLGAVHRAARDFDGAQRNFETALRISRRMGDTRALAFATLGLACLAGDLGDYRRAATLHGAAQAMLDRTGIPWERFDARERQQSLDQVRVALGDEQLQGAYAEGRALSIDRGIGLALEAITVAS